MSRSSPARTGFGGTSRALPGATVAAARFGGSRVVAVNHSCIATWWAAVHGSTLPERYGWCADVIRAGLAAADVVVTPTAAFAAAYLPQAAAFAAQARDWRQARRAEAPLMTP